VLIVLPPFRTGRLPRQAWARRAGRERPNMRTFWRGLAGPTCRNSFCR